MIYIPPIAQNMKDVSVGQIRLGLQGAPGTFKTGSALTFPNPLFLDFDNGLRAYAGRDITKVPFHDREFMETYNNGKYKPTRTGAQHNRRDALLHFLETDGFKLTSEQTLVLDSWTTIQNAFDHQQLLEPKITKKGEIDDFDFWEKKIDYCEKIMTHLAAYKCHVVVTFHEVQERDPLTKRLIDRVAPLMQGRFLASLKLYFTDFFRCHADDETKMENRKQVHVKTEFWWQVRNDEAFIAKTRLILPPGLMRVEPHYKIFEQYSKPIAK